MQNNNFEQPIDFSILCNRIGVTAPYLVELFGINKRTVQYWFKGRYNKPNNPPQAIYNAIYNLNNSFFNLARKVAEDENVEYIITYHDEYSLREQFTDCYFGIASHRAFISIVLTLNPRIKTIPSSGGDQHSIDVDWNKIANVAPMINTDNIKKFT